MTLRSHSVGQVRTGRVYLRDSSMVTPYPLLLFGGELKVRQCHWRACPACSRMQAPTTAPYNLPRQVRHAEQTITIDGWMEFEAPPRVAVLFRQVRVVNCLSIAYHCLCL